LLRAKTDHGEDAKHDKLRDAKRRLRLRRREGLQRRQLLARLHDATKQLK
jgi:hypothetical protein